MKNGKRRKSRRSLKERKKGQEQNIAVKKNLQQVKILTLFSKKIIELLQNIKDPEIRAQIIDKISDSKEKYHISEKDHIPKEIPTKEGSYTMTEVKNLLLERRKMISSPTTIKDLKEEINNLKEDIISLKEKNVVIEVRLDAIQSLKNLDNASESSSSLEGENDNHPNAFWNKKKHVVSLPYEDDFNENNIPTKARPCQMNSEYSELCKKRN
ncbi:hypothetical protein H5410_041559 [Solanum commersonii]|uniref:Uncharacterized protein n=1 Tax=Solanum commersonii TaxID=4109 RepID=A0A9J5XT97_SOLCO|nr:hypothetical protein H5410_041559 [Solanum commersonii]